MRYKTGDVVRAVMAISYGRSHVEKGDVCIVRASVDITAIARYGDDIPTTPKRATTQRATTQRATTQRAAAKRRSGIVVCSVIHLRGGDNMLIPEVQLEPVGKNDDDDTTAD